MMDSIKIDVRVAFEPGGKLGQDYNRIMKESQCDWVLLFDHDVFLDTNPHWYHICQRVIAECDDQVGMFVCFGSRIGNKEQVIKGAPLVDNIPIHQMFAKQVFDQYQYSTTKISKASGMFMLLRRKAWLSVGGFPGKKLFQEDRRFSKYLTNHKWKIMRINGLYLFHLRDRMEVSWIEGEKISNDYLRFDKRKKK
jgi:cellulose synthase/poly-beta-1,6-N-acetylglucosamine synthase-like glycosyltransferase